MDIQHFFFFSANECEEKQKKKRNTNGCRRYSESHATTTTTTYVYSMLRRCWLALRTFVEIRHIFDIFVSRVLRQTRCSQIKIDSGVGLSHVPRICIIHVRDQKNDEEEDCKRMVEEQTKLKCKRFQTYCRPSSKCQFSGNTNVPSERTFLCYTIHLTFVSFCSFFGINFGMVCSFC